MRWSPRQFEPRCSLPRRLPAVVAAPWRLRRGVAGRARRGHVRAAVLPLALVGLLAAIWLVKLVGRRRRLPLGARLGALHLRPGLRWRRAGVPGSGAGPPCRTFMAALATAAVTVMMGWAKAGDAKEDSAAETSNLFIVFPS